MVYFRAVRDRLHGVPASELPRWGDILPRLHLLLPIPTMVFFLMIGDSPFLSAAKTIVLIIMLKLIDLLNSIPTARAHSFWKPFLAISFAFGILVFFFGMDIGPPFSWFVVDYVGIGIGDAGFWVVFTFIVLKIGEILILGPADVTDSAQATASTGAGIGFHEDIKPMRGLGDVFIELVRTVWDSMETGARNTLVVSCITGVLGILLSASTKSDLPGRVASLLVQASGGYLPITIILIIIAGYIVGMGLPIVASYVILAIFAVGALTDLGVPTLAAHMISYWVAVVSAVTPPVALAAFAASSIALSDPVKTGNQAFKLASMILIMPFLFVYTPLLLEGRTFDIVLTVIACLLGVVAWAKFFEGFGIGRDLPFERVFWLVSAACLLLPVGNFFAFIFGTATDLRYQAYIVGALILTGVYVFQYTGRRSAAAE
jgi:TRAP-type uncharacterized transport system fused permease subunit